MAGGMYSCHICQQRTFTSSSSKNSHFEGVHRDVQPGQAQLHPRLDRPAASLPAYNLWTKVPDLPIPPATEASLLPQISARIAIFALLFTTPL
jgi:hypothetical protein